MREGIDLKELERRAYTSYHEDGLLDLFWGLGIVGFVETIFFDMPSTAGIVPSLAIIGYMVAKKRLTIPRIGYVKFSRSESRPLLLFQGLLVATLLLGLLFGVLVFMYLKDMPVWMRMVLQECPHLVVGCSGAMVFATCAHATGLRRFYGYAALALLLFLGGWVLDCEAKRIALVGGMAMMGVGIAMVIRFLSKYPPKEGA